MPTSTSPSSASWPEAYRAVEEAERTGFLVVVLPGQEGPLEFELNRLEIEHAKWEVERFALFVPDGRVDPAEVIVGLGYRY